MVISMNDFENEARALPNDNTGIRDLLIRMAERLDELDIVEIKEDENNE